MLRKALLSPLLLTLIAILVLGTLLYQTQRRKTRSSIYGGLMTLTVVLWFLSTPVGAYLVNVPLERPFYPQAAETLSGGTGTASRPVSLEAVIVLSSGYEQAPLKSLDYLDAYSTRRVIRGVEVYQQSKASWFVVTGQSQTGERERMARLMADLAQSMGVPSKRILIEPDASNTREHPPQVLALSPITRSTNIAVVTSAWHLRRAVREFERSFDTVHPVPADFHTTQFDQGRLVNWLASPHALLQSQLGLHEYFGYIWYSITGPGRS